MPRIAWGYVLSVLAIAVGVGSYSLLERALQTPSIWLFLFFVIIATFLRVFRVLAPGHRMYEGSTIGFFAGALLLPLWQFVLLVIIAHGIEWVKERITDSNVILAWYIQPFNMAKGILSGAIVHAIWYLMNSSLGEPLSFTQLVAIILCIVSYVGFNQVLLGIALYLARGISFGQAGILRDALWIEVPLASIGLIGAVLLSQNPFALPFAFAPIVLIYQAFLLPKVQDEAVESLERFNLELTAANQAIRQVNDDLFFTLAKVFDARDPFVGGHAAQVATYAVAIANELGLPPERVEIIRQSAYLHDIGKIAIPESILHKPGKLTESEYEMIKRHCDIGANFIESSRGLRHLAPFIRYHHERWDGRGYPYRLAGEGIPLEARILNLCDSVEAMASDRPYHRAMSLDEICVEVARCATSQFDPEVARAFIRIAEREGSAFVVNSARSVVAQFANNTYKDESPFVKRLAEIYGTVAVEQ